jgi:predicted ATPase/DNA-binding CsgD family transcriptional regulator
VGFPEVRRARGKGKLLQARPSYGYNAKTGKEELRKQQPMPDTPQPAPKGTAGDPGSVVEFPGTPEGGRPPNNLPLQLSSFIGRGRKVAEVGTLLFDHRLLTLTGPGGSGKTRLALAVASEVMEDFRDGVWVVELAPFFDPDLVAHAVAQALGVREAPGRTMIGALLEHLESRKALLVLDNCEHLIYACATLADTLLRSCPNLRILATSREALSIAGEISWPIPPLSSPDTNSPFPVEELRSYEAISLFVARADAVVSTFELTEHNAPAVVRLCHMLDGMPLAIELAAARVRVLSVEQISSRLEGSLALLTGGSRTAVHHQRTLRATMDWSYDLLSDEEKLLFRRLSVFAGGWTLEAAEAVCAGGGTGEDEVLDLLTSLVGKSLVQVSAQGEDARYRFLETVRQYAREKLEEAGEEADLRRRHAGFFLELAERVEPKINGKDREFWLGRLDAEHDNLRAALAWSREEAEGETALRLSGTLSWFWYHREYWSEWRSCLDEALAIREGSRRTAARAKALSGRGFLAWMQGDQATARSRLEESVALWREEGDKQGLAQALRFLSGSFESQGDYGAARPLAEESVELFREGEDAFGLGITLSRLGITALAQGDHTVARAALEEGVEICRELEDDWALALALRNLGIGALREGKHEEAVARLAESLGVLQETGNPLYMQNLELLAAAVSMRGDHRRAALVFGAAEALREAVGAFVLPLYRAEYDRGVAAARATLDEAHFSSAWSEGRSMTPDEAVEYALGTEEPPASPKETADLSERELEVLRLVADGLTDAQVARELYLSPRTVGWHLRSIYRKLGVPSRAAAARAAVEHSLI